MTKVELITVIAESCDVKKKDAEAMLNSFIEVVEKQVKKNDKVTIPGFGTFELSKRSARTGRNPKTGEEIKIAASKSPKFKPGKGFKDFVN